MGTPFPTHLPPPPHHLDTREGEGAGMSNQWRGGGIYFKSVISMQNKIWAPRAVWNEASLGQLCPQGERPSERQPPWPARSARCRCPWGPSWARE